MDLKRGAILASSGSSATVPHHDEVRRRGFNGSMPMPSAVPILAFDDVGFSSRTARPRMGSTEKDVPLSIWRSGITAS